MFPNLSGLKLVPTPVGDQLAAPARGAGNYPACETPDDCVCAVCYDSLLDPAAGDPDQTRRTIERFANCGHQVHEWCAAKWVGGRMEDACPYCRTPVTEDEKQRLRELYPPPQRRRRPPH